MKYFKILVFSIALVSTSMYAGAQMVNKVVAVVNDEVITQQDVNQLLAVLYAQYAHTYKKDELLKKMEEIKREILKQMIDDRLILSYAKELGLRVREEEIKEKLDYVKKAFSTEEDFYQMLEMQGITVADLKNRYKDQIMMKKLVDFEIKSKIAVLPSEINEYYEKHRTEFKRDERYKVSHILVKAEDDVSFELARVEIEMTYNKLQQGHDFTELAREYSQGPNRERGGDTGYISRGEMLEELDRTIAHLRPGEFSRPVKSQIGYHILKLEDVRDSGYFSAEDMHDDIKKLLFQKGLKEKLNEWLDELRSKAYISIK